jgi:flagellar basal body-associated protein FliL
MKSKSSLFVLLALAAVVGWASVEAYRLWVATQQVAASQSIEMRVSANVESARARQVQFAHADPSARGAGAARK